MSLQKSSLKTKMNQISISIVIPNYNHSAYLPKAITHALNQTYQPIEILIIDDCSTDNSLSVIQEFLDKYPLIRLLKNETNQGVIPTINRGLREAKGSYVLTTAADDWIEPTLLENAQQQFTLHPEAGLFSGGSWIAYEEQPDQLIPARMLHPIKESGYISATQAQKLFMSIDSWFMGNTVIMNKKYALEENGYLPELQSFTDNFLYRVLAAKHGCCFASQKLGTWRICKNSYANTFNGRPENQIQVLGQVIALMQNKYTDIFPQKLTGRIERRLNFNIARAIWLRDQGQMSSILNNFLHMALNNKVLAASLIMALRVANKIPKFRLLLGQVVLFMAIRPFDLAQQIKLQAAIS